VAQECQASVNSWSLHFLGSQVTNGTNFIFHFLQLLDGLVAEYEVAAAGSSKYQKLVKFLQKT
jgi:hypothetical protein